ncbi:unnamed protein product, partial [Nesidiocoris tenuis]
DTNENWTRKSDQDAPRGALLQALPGSRRSTSRNLSWSTPRKLEEQFQKHSLEHSQKAGEALPGSPRSTCRRNPRKLKEHFVEAGGALPGRWKGHLQKHSQEAKGVIQEAIPVTFPGGLQMPKYSDTAELRVGSRD